MFSDTILEQQAPSLYDGRDECKQDSGTASTGVGVLLKPLRMPTVHASYRIR